VCTYAGAAETVNQLRVDYGLKIGCSTGFIRSMVDILLEESAKVGYKPDCSVASDEVPQVNTLKGETLANSNKFAKVYA